MRLRILIIWYIVNFSILDQVVSVRKETNPSRTISLLKEIFGDDELVTNFQKEKQKIKNGLQCSEHCKQIVAKLEVKLKPEYEQNMASLKNLEEETINKTGSLEVMPKELEDQKLYVELKNKLAKLKALLRAIHC